MIRLILIGLFLGIFFILSIPVYLIEWILDKCNKNAKVKSSKFIINAAFKVCLFFAGVKIDVRGTENIPEEACLFVGNHNSYFDILVTYTTIPHPVGYIAKKEIKKIPFLNLWMINISCIFLDRENVKEGLKTIFKAIEQIKSGISVFIFPEGTRSKDGQMAPFKEGSMKIASKANCPIVPVAIKNTADIFENHFPRVKSTKVIVEYGKPIIIDELDKEDQKYLGSYTHGRIQQLLDDM